MRVSVVIPTYNRREQLLRAIQCVLDQTVRVSEIVIVDDGSTDGSAEAVKQFYGSQVRVFQQTNAGVSAARNLGIRESREEWIAFLDSDDWWHPEKLERQFGAIESFEGRSSVCFTNNVYGGNPEMAFSRFEEVGLRNAPAIGMIESDNIISSILFGQEPFFTSSFLIRRTLLDEIGGFDESLTLREDTDLLFRLSFKSPFCFVREPLTEIDRTPSRSIGLCNLYGTRSDLVFDCSERIYRKWLTFSEVTGTWFEQPLRRMLRDMHYASAESKIRQLRLIPALRVLAPLRRMGQNVGSIIATLAARKIWKIKRNWARRRNGSHNETNQPTVYVP